MFSLFFIERPRFAIVISTVITIAGVVGYMALPVAQYPELAPPAVSVTTTYPGAGAEALEQAVTAVIEQEINGVPNMLYMQSTSSNDGQVTITVYFETGTDVDLAAVQVQSRVERAKPKLPQSVQREGIKVEAKSPDILMAVNLVGDPDKYDQLFLGNYVTLNLKDPLLRLPGVGQFTIFGARDYGMRIWLDPNKLRSFSMSPSEVIGAIREQNDFFPAGRIGAPPNLEDQRFQFSVRTTGRLEEVKEFENVIIRANSDGSAVRVKDVARVELGAQNYDLASRLNGELTATFFLYTVPGANALQTKYDVVEQLDRLAERFPPGLSYQITYDATQKIEASISEVLVTLYEAVFLVILVVFIFLANFRATVVPAVAVPVSLVGTFALMVVVGFSINTLSLFGLILAIGIVVDDAIVVVETSIRNIEEGGMDRKQAAREAMKEVSSPVIASTLVLLAVFVPVAFMPGLVGRLYNQFAVTICCAVLISSVNALTLSPALCSLILPDGQSKEPGWLKRTFDRVFEPTRNAYVGMVQWLLGHRTASVGLFGGVLAVTYLIFQVVPGGFVPPEDDGTMFVNVQLPDAASLNRTEAVMRKMEAAVASEPDVQDVISVAGYSLLSGANSSNTGMAIITLKDWSERQSAEQHQFAVMARIQRKLAQIDEAFMYVFQMPPIPGLGTTQGLEFQLQDRSGLPLTVLQEVAGNMVQAAMAQDAIASAVTTFRANVPQVYLDLSREQAKTLGVKLPDVSAVLASNLGAAYINDLTLFGRTFRVMAEAERSYTQAPEDILKLYVPNDQGDSVPLAAFGRVESQVGPETVDRFNLFRSARITANPAPGYSSGQVIQTMEALASQVLPPSMGYEWKGSAVEEKKAGSAASLILIMALVFVYLFLVAQYESFSIPISVMLVIPGAALGAGLAQWLTGLTIDVYTQVGLVLLVGLTAKTAILFVELAKQRVEQGLTPVDAMLESARLRFRAVLMTALTFLLGMIPLVVASGAGAASRRSLGTAVFGGTLVGILATLALVPVFFVIIQGLRPKRTSPPTP